jgi:type I restriction enzyme S subunit
MWAQLRRLDEVCTVVMGQAPIGASYNDRQNGVPLVAGAGDFMNGVPSSKKFTTSPGKLCAPGDIILGIRASIGEKVVADADYCLGRGVAGLRPRPGLSDRYLWHWLSVVRPELIAKGRGATFKQVNREDICELQVPVPSIDEQRRIADILDRADALRVKRRQALAHLEVLTQSIFCDMFGDSPTILARWPTKPLGSILSFLTSGSRGWARFYDERGDKFLRIQNIRHNALVFDDMVRVCAPSNAEAKRTRVQSGDVLLSITADLGRVAVVPEDFGTAYVNQHLSILRSSQINSQFLSSYLSSPSGQRQILGRNRQGVKAGLNFDDIRSFVIPLPPSAVQKRYETAVSEVSKLRVSQKAHLGNLDAMFASLQQRAFTGCL